MRRDQKSCCAHCVTATLAVVTPIYDVCRISQSKLSIRTTQRMNAVGKTPNCRECFILSPVDSSVIEEAWKNLGDNVLMISLPLKNENFYLILFLTL